MAPRRRGNVAYHLTHNTGKFWKIQENVWAPGFEPWWVASYWTVLPLDYKLNRALFHFVGERKGNQDFKMPNLN
jgi:hypothetical protein